MTNEMLLNDYRALPAEETGEGQDPIQGAGWWPLGASVLVLQSYNLKDVLAARTVISAVLIVFVCGFLLHLFPPLQLTEDSLKAFMHVIKIRSEYLDPSRFLLSAGIFEAERHALLVRVPSLHLVPLKGDDLILQLPLLRAGQQLEVLDADGGNDVAFPARVTGTVREHDLVVAFTAP